MAKILRKTMLGIMLTALTISGSVATAGTASAASGTVIRPSARPQVAVINPGLNSGVDLGSPSLARAKWTITATKPGFFKISNVHPDFPDKVLCLDISGGSAGESGFPIVAAKCDGTASQDWGLATTNGRTKLKNRHSGLFMTITIDGSSVKLVRGLQASPNRNST